MTPKVMLVWEDNADRALGPPSYATDAAAGADLRANLRDGAPIVLAPGARALVQTGLRIAVPQGFEAQIRPRSGLALEHGITVLNSPGTIDADYRGPLGIILMNAGDAVFEITHGMRIAQLVVAPAPQARFTIVDDLEATSRGTAGFGSTGTA